MKAGKEGKRLNPEPIECEINLFQGYIEETWASISTHKPERKRSVSPYGVGQGVTTFP